MHRAIFLLLTAVLFIPGFVRLDPSGPNATIPEIQGVGVASPFAGQKLDRPLRGCVTGVAAEGFYLQDPTGDGDPATSDGIYVYRYSTWRNPRGLKPGDLVQLSSYKVTEFYGQTELSGLPSDKNAAYRVLGECPLPAPAAIKAPGDPRVDPVAEYERYEGMRVIVDLEGSVAGPTTRYESRYSAGDPEITVVPVNSPFYGQRIFADQLAADRGTLALTGGLGVDLPAARVLDRITARGLTGVLAYQFGRYVLLVDNPSAIRLEPTAGVLPSVSPAGPDEWTACTFNMENLFDEVDDQDGDVGGWEPKSEAQYRVGLIGRASVIRERAGACTVIAAQEIEGKDAVWADLARELGPNYRFDYRESADVRDLAVGLIYDASRVELRQSGSVTSCSEVDYGVDYQAARGPRADVDPCPGGAYPIYDRAPYIADIVVANAAHDRRSEVRLVVVHLKSKRGDEAENATRRVQQARYVATVLGDPQARAPLAIALGDFNDVLGSAPLAELGPFVNLYERHAPAGDRYSYVYNGRAQAVDHVIMTPEMDAYYLSGGPVHVNADYADPLPGSAGRTSDHDPVVVRFRFEPTGISVALVGAASAGLGWDYHQPLRLK